jgi:hypothetical protein
VPEKPVRRKPTSGCNAELTKVASQLSVEFGAGILPLPSGDDIRARRLCQDRQA